MSNKRTRHMNAKATFGYVSGEVDSVAVWNTETMKYHWHPIDIYDSVDDAYRSLYEDVERGEGCNLSHRQLREFRKMKGNVIHNG